MDIILSIVKNVAILFIMMIPGIIMKKCKLSGENFGKGLSNLILYIAQPVLIFTAYLRPFDKNILINFVYVVIFSAIAHVIFALVANFTYKKAPDMVGRMLNFATTFSNAAFMGMPLIAAVLGDEALLYASAYNIVFNLFLWSVGVRICTKDRDLDGDGDSDECDEKIAKKQQSSYIKKALLHPATLASVLGLIVFFIMPESAVIPSVVSDSLTMIKNLVAPLSMFVIGLRLAEIDFRGFFSDKYLYVFFALRHFVLPLLIVALIRLLAFFGLQLHEYVVMVTVIMVSTPAASSATMFAEKFDCDAAYASKVVTFSTLLSVLTMPAVIYLATL